MARIKAIKDCGVADVYNMEVDNVHNFAVNGGLIVHNCDSLRYWAISWTYPADELKANRGNSTWIEKFFSQDDEEEEGALIKW